MIEQYSPSLYRVGGGTWGVGAKQCSMDGDGNVYLIKGPAGGVLVDIGRGLTHPIIESNLREAGIEPSDVTDLILTHSHWDHTGGAAQWQNQYDVRAHLNAIGADWLARGDHRLVGVMGPDSEFELFRIDHPIEDGEPFTAGGVEIRPTFSPGHTPDSTFMLSDIDDRTVAICGDVCFGIDQQGDLGMIGWLCVMWESNLLHYRNSLQRMGEIKVDVLLPGHGFIIDGAAEVRKTILASLETVEKLLADPLRKHFGVEPR